MSEVLSQREVLNQRKSRAKYMELDWDFITRDPNQDREDFDEAKIDEIASSMRIRVENGDLPNAEDLWVEVLSDGTYQLISGETRHRAAEKIGYDGVMGCKVFHDLTDQERLDLMAIANSGRNDLNQWEKAKAVCKRLEMGQDRQHVMDVFGINKSTLSKLEKFNYGAPEDVKQLARDRIREDLNFLYDVSGVEDDEARASIIEGVRNNSLKGPDLNALIKKAKSGPDAKEAVKRSRKATKFSMDVPKIIAVIDNSDSIRKRIKKIIPGNNGYRQVHGGDLVEAFSTVINDIVGENDG